MKNKLFFLAIYAFIFVSYCEGNTRGIEQLLRKVENKIEQEQIKNIDFIYLINLDQRIDRLNRSLAQLENYGIVPHRFPAIYGWALPREAFEPIGLVFLSGMSFVNNAWLERSIVSFLPGSDRVGLLNEACFGKSCFQYTVMPGAIGCTLSHLSILKDAFEANYQKIWILEDDFVVNRDPHQLSEYIEKLDELVGKDGWDVLYTDIKTGLFYSYETHDCWRPDMPTFDPNTLASITDVSDDFVQIGGRARTHSMIINRQGMKKILDFEINRGIFLPYDAEIAFVPDIKLFCLKHDLVTFSYVYSDTCQRHF